MERSVIKYTKYCAEGAKGFSFGFIESQKLVNRYAGKETFVYFGQNSAHFAVISCPIFFLVQIV